MNSSIRNGIRLMVSAIVVLLFAAAGFAAAGTAEAGYSVGFKSADIEITFPETNLVEMNGSLTVTGKADVEQVFLAVRGPKGEVETYPATPVNGDFAETIGLRFGPGTYTVWAGDNPREFDGEIRFEVHNNDAEDKRYLAGSAYVNADNEEVMALATAITVNCNTETGKARAIHDWVAANIAYDTDRLAANDLTLCSASDILKSRKAICSGYSFLTAALARAAGLEARVVYGHAGSQEWGRQYHAWNQIKADGRWITMDTTWDAGYVSGKRFVAKPGDRYYDNPDTFAETHEFEKYALH